VSKRDLQADIVMVCALANAHTYSQSGQGFVMTREVMRIFDCHRSTATRIMDYCAAHNEYCQIDAVYIGGGRYSKALVVDVPRLMGLDWAVLHDIWIAAHRNRISLGLSYATLDALNAMAGAAYDHTA
jgi:hypothetical protein